MPSKKTLTAEEEVVESLVVDFPTAEPAPVTVKTISIQGKSALVEWDGGARRGFVPVSAIRDGAVSSTTLSDSIPFGVDWARARLASGDLGARLAIQLHSHGIWTKEDLFHNQRGALAALQAAYSVDLSALNTLASQEG